MSKVFFTHIIPYMFNRVNFGTIRRLKEKANIIWNLHLV